MPISLYHTCITFQQISNTCSPGHNILSYRCTFHLITLPSCGNSKGVFLFNSDKIRPYYPLKIDNAIICRQTAPYSHCFITHVYFYTQYILTGYTAKISVNTRGKATHTVQPFLQKICSEGVLKALTLLLFPHPLMPFRVLFGYIHIVCKGRGQGARRGGSLSAVVSAVLLVFVRVGCVCLPCLIILICFT